MGDVLFEQVLVGGAHKVRLGDDTGNEHSDSLRRYLPWSRVNALRRNQLVSLYEMERASSPKVLMIDIPYGGVLSALSTLAATKRLTDEVDHLYGSGLGAMVALLMTCGYTALELMEMAALFDLETGQGRTPTVSFAKSKADLSAGGGYAKLRHRLQQLVQDRLTRVPSLEDLASITGRSYIGSYFNLSDGELVFMHAKNFPTMSCVDAAVLSSIIYDSNYRTTHREKWVTGSYMIDPTPYWYFGDQPVLSIGVEAHTPENVEALSCLHAQAVVKYQSVHRPATVSRITASIIPHRAFNQGLDLLAGLNPEDPTPSRDLYPF